MYYVYILKLCNNSLYIGYSSDLRARLQSHKHGLVSSTKNLRPVTLEYYASFKSREKATKFEKYLKSSSVFAFRNKHLL